MIDGKYTVVSTFSGCGGSSMGYRLAGFKVLAANEFIPIAADTYERNFPGTHVFREDIRALNAGMIFGVTGLKEGELDLLDGSPPCASFSTSGKREQSWGKVKRYSETTQRVDDLFFEYVRLIGQVQPKTFVAENVAGMAIGVAKAVFDEVTELFKRQGYRVACRRLESQFFGVPQKRRRLIWVGVREDLCAARGVEPSHPKPQTRPISFREATADLELTTEDLGPAMMRETSADGKKELESWTLAMKMKPGQVGSDYHPKGHYFNLVRASFDKPVPTILQMHGSIQGAGVLHPTQMRKLTIKEIKRCFGFMDDFVLLGDFAQQWERLGRCVPPPMMRAIALHIRHVVLDKIYGVENDYRPTFYDPDDASGQNTFSFLSDVTEFKRIRESDQPLEALIAVRENIMAGVTAGDLSEELSELEEAGLFIDDAEKSHG